MPQRQTNGPRLRVAERLRRRAKMLFLRQNILGVAVGAGYREKKCQFDCSELCGKRLHWTKYAVVVFVRHKKIPKKKSDRLPGTITIPIGNKKHRRYFPFRVDVVAVGKPRLPHVPLQVQAGGELDLPGSGQCEEGHRFLIGQEAIRAPIVAGLLPDFWYNTGTVGCIAKDSQGNTYLITAAHTLISVYQENALGLLPTENKLVLGFKGSRIDCQIPSNGLPCLPPNIRTVKGLTIDAMALPLCASIVNGQQQQNYKIPDALKLQTFLFARAYLLAERNGKKVILPGTVEAIKIAEESNLFGVRLFHPQLIFMRFDANETSEEGDSGAPLLVNRDNQTYLLGFHVCEAERPEGGVDFRTLSFSIAAYAVFNHLKVYP